MIGQPPRARLRLVATDSPGHQLPTDLERRIAVSRNCEPDDLPPGFSEDYPDDLPHEAPADPLDSFICGLFAGVVITCLLIML